MPCNAIKDHIVKETKLLTFLQHCLKKKQQLSIGLVNFVMFVQTSVFRSIKYNVLSHKAIQNYYSNKKQDLKSQH